MTFNRKSIITWSVLLTSILLLLSSCSMKNTSLESPAALTPVPQEFTVSLCENVFDTFLYGEISEQDLLYLNTEKHIALRETDIIIDEGDESKFWIMTSLRDLIPGQKYTFRYELFSGSDQLFRSESYTFSSDTTEHTAWIVEELNPQDRDNLPAGSWKVNIYVNNTLLTQKQLTILSATPGQDVALKEYRWKDFQFQYPGYSTIEEDRDIVNDDGTQFRLVKLTISEKNRIGLFLYFANDWVPPDDKTSQQSPTMANLMMGLPIALKHAEPAGAEAIALSVGSIELVDGFNLATRFVIIKPDSNTFSSLECFHRSLADKMFFGFLFTQGLKGKGSDTPEYFRFIQDAYTTIRTISTPELITTTREPVQ